MSKLLSSSAKEKPFLHLKVRPSRTPFSCCSADLSYSLEEAALPSLATSTTLRTSSNWLRSISRTVSRCAPQRFILSGY